MILYTDGGARGNPGRSAIGIIIKNDQNEILLEIGKYIGIGTNNEAEYKALIFGLEQILQIRNEPTACFLDSELVVNQLKGVYKVKNENLKSLFEQVKSLGARFDKIAFTHIPRGQNKDADKIVNQTLDAKI